MSADVNSASPTSVQWAQYIVVINVDTTKNCIIFKIFSISLAFK